MLRLTLAFPAVLIQKLLLLTALKQGLILQLFPELDALRNFVRSFDSTKNRGEQELPAALLGKWIIVQTTIDSTLTPGNNVDRARPPVLRNMQQSVGRKASDSFSDVLWQVQGREVKPGRREASPGISTPQPARLQAGWRPAAP